MRQERCQEDQKLRPTDAKGGPKGSKKVERITGYGVCDGRKESRKGEAAEEEEQKQMSKAEVRAKPKEEKKKEQEDE